MHIHSTLSRMNAGSRVCPARKTYEERCKITCEITRLVLLQRGGRLLPGRHWFKWGEHPKLLHKPVVQNGNKLAARFLSPFTRSMICLIQNTNAFQKIYYRAYMYIHLYIYTYVHTYPQTVQSRQSTFAPDAVLQTLVDASKDYNQPLLQ
jgi:hypothetical protein